MPVDLIGTKINFEVFLQSEGCFHSPFSLSKKFLSKRIFKIKSFAQAFLLACLWCKGLRFLLCMPLALGTPSA
ncbi:MAG: hypothetical protein IJA12_06995, partial [Oscillospiraceae bacterium]|nr:hypothetical protein [Oscillospiraceae bacterium]